MAAATPTTRPMTARKANAPRQTALSTTTSNSKKSNGGQKATAVTTKNKTHARPNSSILNFFKKTDEDQLFVSDIYGSATTKLRGGENTKFNEEPGSVKKRKFDSPPEQIDAVLDVNVGVGADTERAANILFEQAGGDAPTPSSIGEIRPSIVKKPSGPFVEESDSESDDDRDSSTTIPEKPTSANTTPEVAVKQDPDEVDIQQQIVNPPAPPTLTHEPTSISIALEDDFDQFADFEGIQDDFQDDVYDQGEEYVERKYLEQQRRLHLDQADVVEDDCFENDIPAETVSETSSCPICGTSLDGSTEQDATTHVNNCLDGKPTPLPDKKATIEMPISDGAAQFKRPPRPPKPAQESPFELGESSSGTSAFSKLMSGKAEDAAWAAASAAENASRGKPAYTRTCPFYKILPGFNICVDAFRYGAVKGCNAYFLSHFHSDHYIGLTSTWTHGPIYCSKVTANLVRQQLRVDPQYIVSLEWETNVEIPGTNGVTVTMISANHCPGSSLFLYEKKLSAHTPEKPKLQRVLHCGDFRACPAHLENPLLMPDIVDKVTGKTRQQKIDVCYLDTTYLNPKYAFPSQTEVIRACADMCVSLNKVSPDDSDGWEQMKRARAGQGMVNFVRKDSDSAAIKEESIDDDDGDEERKSIKIMQNGRLGSEKTRGRLLVVVGTYSIGKERICLGIAHALGSKIYAPPSKARIVRALEDPELDALLTKDPREAQVHMTPLFEIRADTLDEYLTQYADSFGRCVGFRPSGWQYKPPNSRFVDSPSVQTVLHSSNWASRYSMRELVPQRGSTAKASCFGVPYSEHSSFRELTMFCCALRIDRIIPTVNVGSAKSRDRMKQWIERWETERRKNGLFRLGQGTEW